MQFSVISTDRLLIRRLTKEDVLRLAAYRNLPEVSRHQSWETYSTEDARNLIEGLEHEEPGKPGGWFQFGVALQAADLLIGDIGLSIDADQPLCGQIGYTFDPEFQRQGYATEAASAVMAWAFTNLSLHRVSAFTDPRNLPSIALMERLGMRKEGHLRESVYHLGEWTDDVVYGILDREWAPPEPVRS